MTLALRATAIAQDRDGEGWMKSARFIVGAYNVGDLIQIPGTCWIAGSGVTTQGTGMADRVIISNGGY